MHNNSLRTINICNKANEKMVLQYDKNSKFIKEWNSIKEAGNSLNIQRSHISECCNNKRKTAGNYIWKFKIDKGVS